MENKEPPFLLIYVFREPHNTRLLAIQNQGYPGTILYKMNKVSYKSIKFWLFHWKNKSMPVRGYMGKGESGCIFSGTMAGKHLISRSRVFDTGIPTWDQNFLVDLTTIPREHPSRWLHSQTPSFLDVITVPFQVGSPSRQKERWNSQSLFSLILLYKYQASPHKRVFAWDSSKYSDS